MEHNPLSYKGKIGSLEYLGFGLILPIALIGLTFAIAPIALPFIVVVAIYFIIVSAVKRARDIGADITSTVLFTLFLTPFAVGYLLFAPKDRGFISIGRYFLMLFGFMFMFLPIGIVSSFAIPKADLKSQSSNSSQSLCSNDSTKELVGQILKRDLSQNLMSQMLGNSLNEMLDGNITLKNARLINYRKEANLAECKATIILNNQEAEIKYTAQIPREDPNNIYVDIDNDSFGAIFASLMIQNAAQNSK